jgi:hypothetical protein
MKWIKALQSFFCDCWCHGHIEPEYTDCYLCHKEHVNAREII